MISINMVSPYSYAIAVLTAGFVTVASNFAFAADSDAVILGGNQEVPPINTMASASGTIVIGMDQSVSGSITTTGINGTVAHIHEAAQGTNGPVIIGLVRTSDNVWSVPSGSRLNEAQFRAYKAGNLYVNVHSDAFPNGEIRAQIMP
jgi:CHRD domain